MKQRLRQDLCSIFGLSDTLIASNGQVIEIIVNIVLYESSVCRKN